MSRFQAIAQSVYLTYSSIGGKQVTLNDHALDGSKRGVKTGTRMSVNPGIILVNVTDCGDVFFLKIIREAKLMGGKLDAPKVDVIFMRVSGAGKRITYQQFLQALAAVAEVKGLTEEQVYIKLVNADPSAAVTQPEYVKFHDDKELYTGMYQ